MFVSRIDKIWEMVEKIKTGVDILLLILAIEKHFPIYFAKSVVFFNFETKSSLST